MLRISLSEDLAKLTDAIDDVGARHVPMATVIALTRTAQVAKGDLITAMGMELDRPTSFTLNSLFVRPATKAEPAAEVMVKDFAPKGTAAIKYLAPEIYGGQRRIKRFERALQAAGILPQGMYAMPGAACPIDGHGNVPASFIVRMLSQLRAFSQMGYRANETDKGRARRLARAGSLGDWVVIPQQRGKLKPGIYQRHHFGHGNAVKPIFIFTRRAPNYTKRFAFYEHVGRTVDREFPDQFARAFGEQLARWGA